MAHSDQSSGLFLLVFFMLIVVVWVWIKYKRRKEAERRLRALEISEIDTMTGAEFESYVSRLLQARGYSTTITRHTGDQGVDILASRNGERVAVQCKRYAKRVSNKAVQEVTAGRIHYKCASAMVVTNSFYTEGARTLAKSTGCELVDRDTLTNWILQFQAKPL
jgi:restriction system protein